MLQAYSKNVAVTTDNNLPFTAVTMKTGKTATLEGNSTISLNCPGIYSITFNGYGSSTTEGTVGAKLQANGTDIAQAATSATAAAGSNVPISFNTLVAVPPCANKRLNVVYTGSAGTMALANIIVTKLR